jgi:hypothetical protein
LDVQQVAIASGAIVPGDADKSELIRRIFASDPDERMPPPDSGESLTEEQRQQFRRWVESGAEYERHWAFVSPRRPPLPKIEGSAWPRNEIDRFILARLEAEDLKPSPEADRYTLVRRLYLDLVGLPPTPEEADAFVQNDDPAAFEKLVDRLLKSKHYGERWARLWLDLARYADTNGYEKDRPRSIWPYRDWVINALNADMPFDQFTIEQLAGDMLPDATAQQRIATGFHRNTMLNEEGGIDPLEFRFYAMVDRVATTGIAWLGLTAGCAQCHSHKYDPISHEDYYGLLALLNNADEPDLFVPDPVIATRREEIEKQIAKLATELSATFPPADGSEPIDERRQRRLEQKFQEWVKLNRSRTADWTVLRPYDLKTNLPKLEVLEDGSIFSSGDITKRDVFKLKFRLDQLTEPISALRLEVLADDRLPARGPGRAYYEGRKGDFFLSELTTRAVDRKVPVAAASSSYGKISIGSGSADATNLIDGEGSTGWSTSGREGESHQVVLVFAEPLRPSSEFEIEMLFERHFAASLGRFRFSATSSTEGVVAKQMPVDVEALLVRDRRTWEEEDRARLLRYFLSVTPELAESRKPIDKLKEQLPAFPTTMVLQERTADNPRKTHRHHRGEYLSLREEVTPGVPSFLANATDAGPSNRLEFARWLVSEQNPLVGRVAVNRAWRAFFGNGLVRTSGDFGTQSDPPTHPDLLDWLAVEFVDQGWSLKKLHRLIVTSATYRQSSRIAPGLLKADPRNRWLARGPRHRVDAETVRDIMLKASGLLSPKMLGPSVYPPQPATVTALAYGNTPWNPSTGEDRYRRSLYTFSKRTAPFAAFAVFDSPSGEGCTARRNRSNTPLQALTLLNDGMYLEMAQALARETMTQADNTREQRAAFLFRRLLTRPATDIELTALTEFQRAQQGRLESGELSAAAIGGDKAATAELAAWVMVVRAVMNLDETITKQ